MRLTYPRVQRLHATACPPPFAASATSPAPRPAVAPRPDDLVVDLLRRTVSVAGRQIQLTFMEFELLAHLVARPRQVHTRGQLFRAVWNRPAVGGTRTIDVHIARLRGKLGPYHRGALTTVRGVGYSYDPSRLSQG
ncbi:winged helix-turn-helix domain-containing protein [Streptomyces gamaensis]|uniref:Winged helix-turn-helix domain-containing protein n=1 Tax=Streptomyces gamaensis TaxID=1763542 RepID=A0ABW0Z9Z9_9ACTN